MSQLFIDFSGGTATQAEKEEVERIKRIVGQQRIDDLRHSVFWPALRNGETDWPNVWQAFLKVLREEVKH